MTLEPSPRLRRIKILRRKNTFASVTFDAVKIIVPVIIVLALLEAFGVNVNGLIAGLGIAGAIVGLRCRIF